MNLLNQFIKMLSKAKVKYFHFIIVLCGITATVVNFIFFKGSELCIVEGIICTMLLVMYIGAIVLLEDFSKSDNEEDEKRGFEKRGELIRSRFEDLKDAYWEYNFNSHEINVSGKLFKLIGYEISSSEDLNEIYSTKILPEDREVLRDSFNKYGQGKIPTFECDFRMLTDKGKYSWFNIRAMKQMDVNSDNILSGIVSDISSRKYIEDKINYMAYYDNLTGLPNKTFFQSYIINSIENNKSKFLNSALVLIDIDDFKNINDTLGHDYGDQLLKIMSELLKVTFEDIYMISRVGGDEFLLLVENYKDIEEVMVICEGIIRMLKNPIEIGDKVLYITVSMGVALYLSGDFDIAALIKHSETAMYKSKETGKNKYSFYDFSMGQELERRMKISNLLREAVIKKELNIVYQPQYNIKTNEIISMEALVRWNSKELGNIPPIEFIRIAESNGTISDIGRWVLEEVCKQNSIWKLRGYKYNSIAVNISPIQLQEENFVSHIKNTIIANKIEPKSLEIEITESLLLGNLHLSERKLHAIKNFGVKIAIDDFGTGYSSLNYLTFLPLDTLKIDKSFIDNITLLNNDRILAQNIIKLSHDLGMKVIAEGVETKEQLEILNDINCDIIQGYYLSRPLTIEAIEDQLERTFKATNGVDNNG